MPGSTRTASLFAAVGAVLAASVLATAGAASAADVGNPGYHYAAAHTQVLPERVPGLTATLSVHRPGQVRGGSGQHSVAQIAVGNTRDRSYLEAGWRQGRSGPRLFVYWRPASGADTCYNLGCGFQRRGPGLRPGAKLARGSELTIGFRHRGNKWWLKVDGKKSGFFPDRLWQGAFQGTDFAQLYGEVYVPPSHKLCADMGNGIPAWKPKAASIGNVRWVGGPEVRLHRSPSVREVHGYSYHQTGPSSFRYGGPGEC